MQERFWNGNSWGKFTSLKEVPNTESEKTRAVEIRDMKLWIKASQPVWDGGLQITRNSYQRRRHWLKSALQISLHHAHCIFLGLSPWQLHRKNSFPIEFQLKTPLKPGFKAMFPKAVHFFWSVPCTDEVHTQQTSVGFCLVNLSASLLEAVRVKTWAKQKEAYPLSLYYTDHRYVLHLWWKATFWDRLQKS